MFKGFNRKEIVKRAMDVARGEYQAGKLTAEQMQERAKYISGVRGTLERLKREADARHKYLERTDRHLKMVRDGVGANVLFVSIDTGFDPNTEELQEVGVTTMKNGEEITTNYIVSGFESVRTIPCHLGHTMVMELDLLKLYIQSIYDEADYVVFHAAHKDKELLGLNTTATRYFDTAFLCHRYYEGDTPALSTLCDRYDANTTNIHNSGVDSALTLECLLKLAFDSRKPYFYTKK